LDNDILSKIKAKHTPTPILYDLDKNLGKFELIDVYEDHVHHCNEDRTIAWLNPWAFYFKWQEGNEQIWVYDSSVDAYLQIGSDKSCVNKVINHTANTRRRI